MSPVLSVLFLLVAEFLLLMYNLLRALEAWSNSFKVSSLRAIQLWYWWTLSPSCSWQSWVSVGWHCVTYFWCPIAKQEEKCPMPDLSDCCLIYFRLIAKIYFDCLLCESVSSEACESEIDFCLKYWNSYRQLPAVVPVLVAICVIWPTFGHFL